MIYNLQFDFPEMLVQAILVQAILVQAIKYRWIQAIEAIFKWASIFNAQTCLQICPRNCYSVILALKAGFEIGIFGLPRLSLNLCYGYLRLCFTSMSPAP